MSPDEDGGESPYKIDIEYEWLPQKCTSCMTLGHSAKECRVKKVVQSTKPPVTVYVPKLGPARDGCEKGTNQSACSEQVEDQDILTKEMGSSRVDKGKAIFTYNAIDALHLIHEANEALGGPKACSSLCLEPSVRDLVAEFRLQLFDLIQTRVQLNNVARIQSFLMPQWKWFVDYAIVEPLIILFIITIIYGANEVAARRDLWGTLEALTLNCVDIPWMVRGDFNAVRDLSEVCGTSGDIRMAMEEFNSYIQNSGPYHCLCRMNGLLRNYNASPRNLWKRLDRILTNDIWMLRHPTLSYTCLTPRTSDHSPLVISGDSQRQFGVTRKLKALKPIFRELRREKGNLSHHVHLAKEFLDMAQNVVTLNRHDELYIYLEHYCRLVYAKAAKLEQNMLQQRAKMQWMKEGDQCTRVFFHKIAHRRAVKRVLQINDGHGEFISYYQSLLGGNRRWEVLDLRFLWPWARRLVDKDEASQLIKPFTAEDQGYENPRETTGRIVCANCHLANSPTVWTVVGDEVTRAVLDFFATGKLLKQINCTLLAVIHKVHSPITVADFRPISCCNVIYMVIAKLLVQRLSVVLGKVVSPCLAAFIPGRGIGDNIMMAQELFTGYNQKRLPSRCALKVDIRKAYDTMEWDFLLATLQLFGFLVIFMRWIEECIITPSFSMSLNGKAHNFFVRSRGLRQGDPLSPYLFVLVMEVMHLVFLQIIEQDGCFQFHWKCEASNIFQLGFAGDVILFSRAEVDSIRVFKDGLDHFGDWSGLQLNAQKSHLILSRALKE
ncbi:UNVERIFIED_CONTAM: Transposon TX1 uncharacterized protein [Sesamum indicum]